jgi:chaperonin GroES
MSKNNFAIKMMSDRILISLSKEAGERRSKSGILIPATAEIDKRLIWGDVISTGSTVREVVEADKVLFHPEDGFDVEINATGYVIIHEKDIHALASKEETSPQGLYL